MQPWEAKLTSAFVLFFLSFILGIIPIFIINRLQGGKDDWRSRHPRANFVLGLFSAFGGGVFLSTAFLILLPEARHWFDIVFAVADKDEEYPVAEAVAIAGLILVMFIEHVVMWLQHRGDDFPDLHGHRRAMEQGYPGQGYPQPGHHNPGAMVPYQSHGRGNFPPGHPNPAYPGPGPSYHRDFRSPTAGPPWNPYSLAFSPYTGVHMVHHQPHPLGPQPQRLGNSVHMIEASHFDHHRAHPQSLRGVRSFVLLLALSIHTIFDGLALGLLHSTKLVWSLLLAMCLHKSVIVFILGLQLSENVRRRRVVLFMFLFSLMTPIGIGIGVAISEKDSSQGQNIATAILQSISAGVFLYVTFFEVLHKEVGRDHSVLKVLAMVVGVGVMMGLASMHSHGDHGDMHGDDHGELHDDDHGDLHGDELDHLHGH